MSQIKEVFDEKVRGRAPMVSHGGHEGAEGHWLQVQFGLTADSKNAPDFHGFELRDDTTSKTTFGDWPADQYIFFSHKKCLASRLKAAECRKCSRSQLTRDQFFEIFGSPTSAKGGRLSWSGRVFPKVGNVNEFGQEMSVLVDGTVEIHYRYSVDGNPNKRVRVPKPLQEDDVLLARWTSENLAKRLENKFNKLGWFKCIQESKGHGRYIGIQFGRPITFPLWIQLVRDGVVYLDSGMYQGNSRPYSNWRADNRLWTSLCDEFYGDNA
jgi:hypothetical protein